MRGLAELRHFNTVHNQRSSVLSSPPTGRRLRASPDDELRQGPPALRASVCIPDYHEGDHADDRNG